ncbi:MAG: carboxypeptidase-like regulatory domain-containing protein, partial [Bacteroidota bacterium]
MKKISQLIFLFLFVGVATTFAQGEKQTIRFSGLVVEGDSMSPIVGAHVYLPKIGKGTITNPYGY